MAKLPRMVYRAVLITCLTSGLLANAASPGLAAETFSFTEKIDETSHDETTSEFCGFDVTQHVRGTITFVSIFSTKGTKVSSRSALIGPVRQTFTNVATGQTVEFFNSGVGIESSSFDLTTDQFTAMFTGLNYRVRTEDGTFTSAGSFAIGGTFTFDQQGLITDIEVTGHAATPTLYHYYPVLCALLGAVDSDHDYLPDFEGIRTESAFGTDPANPDTDGDGYLDGLEVANETDPTSPASHPQDAIGDADKDDDFLWDGVEVIAYGTDPTNPDTDGDGALDGVEVLIFGTDPLDPGSHP